MTRRDPVPDEVAVELSRLVQRWQQLPLDRARAATPAVHALMATIVEPPAPTGGPEVVMAQLRVLVHDACEAGRGAELAPALAALRRAVG